MEENVKVCQHSRWISITPSGAVIFLVEILMAQHKVQSIGHPTPWLLWRIIGEAEASLPLLEVRVEAMAPGRAEHLLLPGQVVLTVWSWHLSPALWAAPPPELIVASSLSDPCIVLVGPGNSFCWNNTFNFNQHMERRSWGGKPGGPCPTPGKICYLCRTKMGAWQDRNGKFGWR